MIVEEVKTCLICTDRRHVILHDDVRGYKAVRCVGCGFVYCDSQPTNEELEKYYSNSHGLAVDAVTGDIHKCARQYKDTTTMLRLIRRYNPSAGNICEVGCSYGYLLWGLRRAGYKVKGYELSSTTARIGREKLGLDIASGQIDEHESETFDVCILRHVLEHLKRPDRTIAAVGAATAPGGLLIAVTPNIASLTARLFGRTWNWMDPPLHLFYFNRTTMAGLLERHGFQILNVFTRRGDSPSFYGHFCRWLRRPAARPDGPAAAASGPATVAKTLVRAACEALHLITWPLWWLIWKLGCGEELWVIARKTKGGFE